MDWIQLWQIASAPDNVPILIMLALVGFYTCYAFKQAFANDRLAAELEADPVMQKTHHRKRFPFQKGWAERVHVWPYLLKIEFLAAIIVTAILIVWSITLDAPLEEPANPSLTMNPSKAPWYFLGLQEMLVYFDPWIAGVVAPGIIVVGLMVIPYVDVNPLGNGYYTYKQRKFAIWTFLFGFLILWVLLVFIGTFIRGPGWQWFWPGTFWDHHRVVHETNRNLHEIFGISGQPAEGIFGAAVVGGYFALGMAAFHVLFKKFANNAYRAMNIVQLLIVNSLFVMMMGMPVKIIARLAFRIKYVWVTPWFNI
ncbi:MAG: cytochrome C [Phycisphaerales bacterium]|nr:cytochrome C [Phycisphaerales bacterium]